MISISNQSFRALGASPRVVEARSARHGVAVRDPGARDSGGDRGRRRACEGPNRLGQDHRLRRPARRAHRSKSPTPSALVLVPTRELALRSPASAPLPGHGPARRRRLRRCTAPRPGQASKRSAHPHRHARQAHGPRRAQDAHALQHSHARPRRGRPDARHGLQAAGRADRPKLPADRQTMLFSATLDGEVGTWLVRSRRTRRASSPRAFRTGTRPRSSIVSSR